MTDAQFFQGSGKDIALAAAMSGLPILRKDFLTNPIQVTEARALGADCILLIFAMLDDIQARELLDAALELNLDTLIEVHNDVELDRALPCNACLL